MDKEMKDIKGVVLSDIHLGNSRNKTRDIVNNMIAEISRHTDVDMIILAGDLYDRILSFGSDEAITSIAFMTWLVDFSKKNDIILRLLEGTPSHDFGQCAVFEEMFGNDKDIDFRYVSDIEVETISKFNINILYVPDEARKTVEETMHVIDTLREGKDIHIAVMHGQFHYQLPFKLESSFEEDRFKFVEYFIFIGHVHEFNPKGKIIPQGSFDRLAHGNDGPKGYIRFRINPNTGGSYKFIENKNAKLFDTIIIKTSDMTKASAQLQKKLLGYPSDYLRIEVRDESIDTTVLVDLARKHNVTLTVKDKTKTKEIDEETTLLESTQFSITPDNVSTLLLARIEVTDDTKTIINSELKDLLSWT